jgi:hypothetical protein
MIATSTSTSHCSTKLIAVADKLNSSSSSYSSHSSSSSSSPSPPSSTASSYTTNTNTVNNAANNFNHKLNSFHSLSSSSNSYSDSFSSLPSSSNRSNLGINSGSGFYPWKKLPDMSSSPSSMSTNNNVSPTTSSFYPYFHNHPSTGASCSNPLLDYSNLVKNSSSSSMGLSSSNLPNQYGNMSSSTGYQELYSSNANNLNPSEYTHSLATHQNFLHKAILDHNSYYNSENNHSVGGGHMHHDEGLNHHQMHPTQPISNWWGNINTSGVNSNWPLSSNMHHQTQASQAALFHLNQAATHGNSGNYDQEYVSNVTPSHFDSTPSNMGAYGQLSGGSIESIDKAMSKQAVSASLPNDAPKLGKVRAKQSAGSKNTVTSLDEAGNPKPVGRSKGRASSRTSCDCPNCVELDRLEPNATIATIKKRNVHSCHIAGCGKIYNKTSHLKAHLRWHTG